MAIYSLKRSYQLKNLQEVGFKDLWGDHGIFTTMWIFGKPPKILFFENHIKNLVKSLKIYHVKKTSLKKDILEIINENDNEFKYHLDRFKYATRYKDSDEEFHFTNAIKFIKRWNELLAENKYFFGDSPTIADWSVWPFVRQFKIACESQKRINYFEPSIKNWLDSFEKNKEFKSLMYKYELWEPNNRKNYFPFN